MLPAQSGADFFFDNKRLFAYAIMLLSRSSGGGEQIQSNYSFLLLPEYLRKVSNG